MKDIVFTTNFHPNEEVATEMARLVAERLRQEGCKVQIVDLEKLRREIGKPHWAKEYAQNDMARGKLLLEAMTKYSGVFFDFHDSPPDGLRQRYNTDEPTLELTRGGYHLVETPAVYVTQEDPEISRNAEGEGLLNRYFVRRSDVNLSHEAGFLSSESVELLAGKILEIAKRTKNNKFPPDKT